MDEDNIEELERKKPKGSKAKVELLGKYDPQGDVIIRDPYYVSNLYRYYSFFFNKN